MKDMVTSLKKILFGGETHVWKNNQSPRCYIWCNYKVLHGFQKRMPSSIWEPWTASQRKKNHIKWDVDIQLYRKRQIAGIGGPGLPKFVINPFKLLLIKDHREMYTQKLMISFGLKSVGMGELGQTIRIMKARLPWAEVTPVSFASFCPVLHPSSHLLQAPSGWGCNSSLWLTAPLVAHCKTIMTALHGFTCYPLCSAQGKASLTSWWSMKCLRNDQF